MTTLEKLEKLQKDFYSILNEICKSESWGGGFSNIKLLYKDLCKLKDSLDDIIKDLRETNNDSN